MTTDSRLAHADADNTHEHLDQEQALTQAAKTETYEPVSVHVANATVSQQGSYSTVIVPESVAGNPAVSQLLPHDPTRVRAYVMSLDEDIVLNTSEQAAASPANVAGTFPIGAYLPKNVMSPRIEHKEPVYAANTSTGAVTRVVVFVERS